MAIRARGIYRLYGGRKFWRASTQEQASFKTSSRSCPPFLITKHITAIRLFDNSELQIFSYGSLDSEELPDTILILVRSFLLFLKPL